MTRHELPLRAITAASSTAPPSFNGDLTLFAWNLFVMTAVTFLGFMMAGKQFGRIWTQRRYDHLLHPISLYRLITGLAGMAAFLRCGAQALLLWGWNPLNPVATARVLMAQRWIDPIAVGCGVLWMAIVVLGEPGIEHQLRKAPLPVDMWTRWPALMRAAGVLILSLVAALAAVILR